METTNQDPDPVDFARIQETSDGDKEFEEELFGVFLEDCEIRLGQMKAAMESGDLDSFCREAHTIKGAGSNVGTTRLQILAADLEKMEGDAITREGERAVQELESEFARVSAAINAYLGAG